MVVNQAIHVNVKTVKMTLLIDHEAELELIMDMSPEERRRHFIWLEGKAANERLDRLASEMKQTNDEIKSEMSASNNYLERYKGGDEEALVPLESAVEYIKGLKQYKAWLFKQLKETGENIRWLRMEYKMKSKSSKQPDSKMQ